MIAQLVCSGSGAQRPAKDKDPQRASPLFLKCYGFGFGFECLHQVLNTNTELAAGCWCPANQQRQPATSNQNRRTSHIARSRLHSSLHTRSIDACRDLVLGQNLSAPQGQKRRISEGTEALWVVGCCYLLHKTTLYGNYTGSTTQSLLKQPK